jgi:hypothetical protein
MMDGTLFDWEGMDLPLWDSFPFLAESTTMWHKIHTLGRYITYNPTY